MATICTVTHRPRWFGWLSLSVCVVMCSLETSLSLGPLGAGVGLDAGSGDTSSAEVSLGFAHLGASEEDGVRAGGGLHDQLIDGHALSTSLHNAGARGLSEAKGSHFHFGEVESAMVVSDGAHDDGGAVGAGAKAGDNLAEGDWRSHGS